MMIETVNSDTNDCDDYWVEINSIQNNYSMQEKIKLWEDKAPTICTDKGSYFFGLAKLHFQANDQAKMNKIIEENMRHFSGYHQEEIALLKADALFVQYSLQESISKQDWSNLKKEYQKIIDAHPKWWGGYRGLGSIYLALDEFKEAIKLLEQSVDMEPNAQAYRHLTVAYYQLSEYEKGVKSADMAYRIDHNVFADRDFMLSYFGISLEQEKLDLARKILMELIKNKPEVKMDKGFGWAVGELQKRMQEKGQIE